MPLEETCDRKHAALFEKPQFFKKPDWLEVIHLEIISLEVIFLEVISLEIIGRERALIL